MASERHECLMQIGECVESRALMIGAHGTVRQRGRKLAGMALGKKKFRSGR